ncbi:glycosyl hydrolase family 71-domain-containing protein [Schizophyllum commune]
MRTTLLFTALVSTAILSSPATAHRRRWVLRARHDFDLSNRALIESDVEACIRIGGSAESCHSGSDDGNSQSNISGSGSGPSSGATSATVGVSTPVVTASGTEGAPVSGSSASGSSGAATSTAPATTVSGSAPDASITVSAPGSSGSGFVTGTASGSGAVPGTATATSGAPSATSSVIAYDGEKYAIVHHMLGNTYTYRLADWITDLVLIQEAGFDAVALNTGPDCWQKASADLAYQAAAALNTPLKLYWSFDMNTFPQAGDEDAAKIAAYINEYATNPFTFKVNGLPFVSTFSGDQYSSSFGKSVCGGWDYVRSLVPTDMYFVPAFFFANNQTIAGVKDCVQGLFQWNSAWSMDDGEVSKSTDLDWATQLGANKTYMAGISPTFFSHYPTEGLNKNWVYRADNNYAKRWQQATEINAPMVQLQPTNTTWVNANNHLPWARITKPYIETYKTGKPAALGSDLIVWEYRMHPANATATADPMGLPERAELLKDEIYITAYLSAPAEVRVQVGSLEGKFQAEAGLNHFTQPFAPGFVTVGMWRDGENVGGTLTGEREIIAEPALYDFNPVVEQFFHDPAWEACKA